MKCRLPLRIGTPSGGGGTSYPEGAFIPVTKFTDGKTYALVAKIDGVYRFINTTAFNNYTMNATEVAVTAGNGYVTFGSDPALFTATASGDGFTLANGSNFLHGTSSGGTALRVGTTSAVWKVDTSETGGFDSGKYLPQEVSSSVWLKNTANNYDWCIKYESGNKSFGYDRPGRDNTYSTGFVSFILYEKYEGGSGDSGGGSGGSTPSEYTINITGVSDVNYAYVSVDGTKYTGGSTITVSSGKQVKIYAFGYVEGQITLNGTTVHTSSSEYAYTVTSNCTIAFSTKSLGQGIIAAITTEGSSGGGGTTTQEYALTINDTVGAFNYGGFRFVVDGTTYSSNTTLAVKSGTEVTITCVTSGNAIAVQLNGTYVHLVDSTNPYSFTVTSNTSITTGSQNGDVWFEITTE